MRAIHFCCCVFDVEMCAYYCDSLVLLMTKHWETESVVEERHLHALTLEALVDEAKLTFHLKYHERHLHALTLEALVVTRDPVMKKTSNPKRTLNVRDSASEKASNQDNVPLILHAQTHTHTHTHAHTHAHAHASDRSHFGSRLDQVCVLFGRRVTQHGSPGFSLVASAQRHSETLR